MPISSDLWHGRLLGFSNIDIAERMASDLGKTWSLRLFSKDDRIEVLNALLRAAYRPLTQLGLRYAASHEGPESTRRNLEGAECYLLYNALQLVGCILLRPPGQANHGPAWYLNPGVATFGRFAVDPKFQKQGLGRRLLDCVEKRAAELGASEIALDTSEHAAHLIKMYEDRGYRFIEHHQWSITNYRSVVMSKRLP